jgi:hypothetical protein
MSSDAWPSPDQAPAPLPRIEDLPISEQGYDQEAVRLAFDSFYRHAAQLDASLRALEAVEVFRRDADALRNDLRALRALGLGGRSAEPAWATQTYVRERPAVPAVVFRLAAEAALIVAVAVIAGVAHFRSVTIVLLMAAAFAIVVIAEWLAARARFIPPAVAFVSDGEPAPYVEAPAPWQTTPALEPGEDTEPDALTIVEAPAVADDEADVEAEAENEPEEDAEPEDEAEPAADPWEQGPEDEGEPELAERAGFFKRRRR